jgi:hypothetical protein
VTKKKRWKLQQRGRLRERRSRGRSATWQRPSHHHVALDAQGGLQSFTVEDFARHNVTSGNGSDDLPLSGTVTRGDQTVTVDPAIAPDPDHFVLRYHVVDASWLNDFRERVEGTRSGDMLLVRHFIAGKLFGSTIDAHAVGALLPLLP